jgi:hypothetical protein
MADRKLKAKLELDTSEARRKLRRDLSESAEGGGGAAGGASKLAQSLDKAAASADKTAQSFNMTQSSAMRLTRGFAGIAVGLATSYAANYVTDPNAKAGLGYLGSGLAGAASGAMIGSVVPGIGTAVGAVVGGAAGIAKTYMDNEGEKSAMSKDFEQAEAVYAAMREKNAKFQELSNVKDGADIAANLAEAKKIIENYTATTADFVQQVRDELKKMNPDKELIAKLRRNIDYNRGEIQRYEALAKTLEELQNKQTTPRGSMAALDSLTKIGGIAATPAAAIAEAAEAVTGSAGGVGFGFSVPTTPADTTEFSARSEGLMSDFEATMKMANERIEKIDADQLKVLTEIKDALKGQGVTSTWQ